MQRVIRHAEQGVCTGKNLDKQRHPLFSNGTIVGWTSTVAGWNSTIANNNGTIVGGTGDE